MTININKNITVFHPDRLFDNQMNHCCDIIHLSDNYGNSVKCLITP